MLRALQIFLAISFIFIVAGCSNEDIHKENLLKRIETSFIEQGFKLENEGLQSDNELEGAIPYKYWVKLDNEEADYILVYFFSSNEAAKNAIDHQHYTISTLTNFNNYIYDNALIVHFAPMGDLKKYKEQIDKAVSHL